MNATPSPVPAWRGTSPWSHLADGPGQPFDSRGNWAERAWDHAAHWVGLLERQSLYHLPWRNYPAVFDDATFEAMVEIRDAAQALVRRFDEDDSITVAQVIATIDKYVEVWESAVHVAKAAGRLRGKTVRQLRV